MSLNEIRLTPSVVADLYTDKLLYQQKAQQNNAAPSVPLFLGKNEKQILIVTIDHEAVFLADQHLAFLTTVLDACKLGLTDVAIVNWQNQDDETRAHLTELVGAKTVILFGIEPSLFGLPVNFPEFQVQELNKKTYMHAPALGNFENNVELKKKLWASLKKIFLI